MEQLPQGLLFQEEAGRSDLLLFASRLSIMLPVQPLILPAFLESGLAAYIVIPAKLWHLDHAFVELLHLFGGES